jgi:hypothetical protein
MADEVRIPSRREIARLPRWVRVAFALRCARRVHPLLRAVFPDALVKYVVAIEHPLQRVERAYDAAHGLDAHVAAIEAEREASTAADAISTSATTDAQTATVRVALAVVAAAKAAISVYQDKDDNVSTAAFGAAKAAFAAADIVGATIVRPIRRDLLTLKEASKNEHWTDETRPSLESLGPLWLEGEEPNWKEVVQRKQRGKKQRGKQTGEGQEERLIISAYVDESVGDDTLVEGITELYRALNKYDILCGGSGLTIDDWRIFVRTDKPEWVLA